MLDPLSLDIPLGRPLTSVLTPPRPQRKLLQPSSNHPDDYILELDYSSLSDYLICPTRGFNKLVLAREAARETTATNFGKLFHSCEEHRLKHGFSAATTASQNLLVQDFFLSNPVPPDEYRTSDRMLDVLRKYREIYAQDNWHAKVLQIDGAPFVERPFKIELGSVEVNAKLPYNRNELVVKTDWSKEQEIFYFGLPNFPIRNLHLLLTGKIDAVLHDSNSLWVVDHKTSSRGGREFLESFRLSLQTRGYVWAAKRILPPDLAATMQGLLMNAVVVRPLTKTGTGTEFQRHSYFYSDDLLADFEDSVRDHIASFISRLVSGRFPQVALSFKSPCAGCDYSENCPLPRSQRAADLASALYRDVTWSPIHE